MKIRATITQDEFTDLRILSGSTATFRGRTYNFSTTFFDCLEIKGIRDERGRNITASEMRNWSSLMFSSDVGLMALFASNREWKNIKIGIEQYSTKVDVVAARQQHQDEVHADIAHLMYVCQKVGDDQAFARVRTPNGQMERMSCSDTYNLVALGHADEVYVLVKVGNFSRYMALTEFARLVPEQPKTTYANEETIMSGTEAVGRLIGIGLEMLVNRRKA